LSKRYMILECRQVSFSSQYSQKWSHSGHMDTVSFRQISWLKRVEIVWTDRSKMKYRLSVCKVQSSNYVRCVQANMGDCSTLGILFLIWPAFSRTSSCTIKLDKNGLGYILVDFWRPLGHVALDLCTYCITF
jgi:hypothetical protein